MDWKLLLYSFIIVFFVGFIGSLFTNTGSGWYDGVRPSITPPNFVFPIVWNLLFLMIVFSMYFVWKKRKDLVKFYIINLLFNGLWTVFYFGLKNVLLAFIDLILIWGSIIYLIFIVWKVDKRASVLLIPYLLWVSFAGILNYLSF